MEVLRAGRDIRSVANGHNVVKEATPNMKQLKEFGIDTNHRTFFVAEIGINHGGDIRLAKKLIKSAARARCDAVKFQTYLTEKRAPPDNKEIFSLLKQCELRFRDFQELKRYSDELGVVFFSTPFDAESVDFLESIEVPIYKIASFDVVNQPLLRSISKTGKPIIMSVGMSNLEEITKAIQILSSDGSQIALLHCVSSYPTFSEDSNLAAIGTLKRTFPECIVGHSDHTNGIIVPIYAVAGGAQIIEKHYRIDSAMRCVDEEVSITERQTEELIREIRLLEKILGDGIVEMKDVEKSSTIFRREAAN